MNKFIVFMSPTLGLLFYPSWSTEIQYEEVNLPSRHDMTEIIFSVTLQDPLPTGEFTFYAGLSNKQFEFPAGISSAYIKIANKPVAKFTVTPKTGKVWQTTFYLDASESYDEETPKALLQVRWQWEEGWGFTSWNTKKKGQHQFPEAGTKTIVVEVKDMDEFVDSTSLQIEVTE
jgi:hypothetical protein